MNHDLSRTTDENKNSADVKSTQAASASSNKWEKLKKGSLQAESLEKQTDAAIEAESPLEAQKEADNQDTFARLQQSLTEAEQCIASLQKEKIYLQATLQNERRRASLDEARAKLSTKENTVKPLLSILDNLGKSLEQPTTYEQLREGIQHILLLISNIFIELGIQTIDPKLGEMFDPHLHAAISTEVGKADQMPNTIISVLQKGYQLQERVIRPAMVTVYRANEE
jgi:molecular chaperone GrpE